MAKITFEKNESSKLWEAEYSGKSGALHVERKALEATEDNSFNILIKTSETAEAKRTLAENGSLKGTVFDIYLDMRYIKKAKLTSKSEVTLCEINTEE